MVRGRPAIIETLYESDEENAQRYTSLRVSLSACRISRWAIPVPTLLETPGELRTP